MEIIVILILVILWYFFGKMNEKKHYTYIYQKEEELKDILILDEESLEFFTIEKSELVSGSVVISLDYFKRFIFGFINIFWGRVTVFEPLLDRARREALIRAKQKCKDAGCNAIAQLRIETSSISKWTKGSVWSVEVYAYWTALLTSKKSKLWSSQPHDPK